MAPYTTPTATPEDIRTALRGLSFPVAKDEVLRHAQDLGGVDREVAEAIARIPERSYGGAEEPVAAIRAVYLLEGMPPGAIPI